MRLQTLSLSAAENNECRYLQVWIGGRGDPDVWREEKGREVVERKVAVPAPTTHTPLVHTTDLQPFLHSRRISLLSARGATGPPITEELGRSSQQERANHSQCQRTVAESGPSRRVGVLGFRRAPWAALESVEIALLYGRVYIR